MGHYGDFYPDPEGDRIRELSPPLSELPEITAANLSHNIGRARYYKERLEALQGALQTIKKEMKL